MDTIRNDETYRPHHERYKKAELLRTSCRFTHRFSIISYLIPPSLRLLSLQWPCSTRKCHSIKTGKGLTNKLLAKFLIPSMNHTQICLRRTNHTSSPNQAQPERLGRRHTANHTLDMTISLTIQRIMHAINRLSQSKANSINHIRPPTRSKSGLSSAPHLNQIARPLQTTTSSPS